MAPPEPIGRLHLIKLEEQAIAHATSGRLPAWYTTVNNVFSSRITLVQGSDLSNPVCWTVQAPLPESYGCFHRQRKAARQVQDGEIYERRVCVH